MKIIQSLLGPLTLALALTTGATAQQQGAPRPPPPPPPGSWMGGAPGGQPQGVPGAQSQGAPGAQTQGAPGAQTQGAPGAQTQGAPSGRNQGNGRLGRPRAEGPPPCRGEGEVCDQLAMVHEALQNSLGQVFPAIHGLVRARYLADAGMNERAADLAEDSMRRYDEALSNLDELSERVEALYDGAVSIADSGDEVEEGDEDEGDYDDDYDDYYDDEVTDEADEVLEGF